ncbi:MAG: hypothetical protein H6Q14_1738 [Bacteroidetes bacterium]|nr:hypothetical protein [Bacteroidota bacterium]
MTGNLYSRWGIKDSGEDITTDILDMLRNANSFIVVGGYNFTFKTAGYSFFGILLDKVKQGIPILMIIPPNMTGFHNNQPTIINFCITNGIGLILNGNNHSKWLMTENDLYYGSSNFTETSWQKRVEVITIHKHNHILTDWKRRTILDFHSFIMREIGKITRRRTMTTILGLVTKTIDVWTTINPLILRLNPSIEKVILTLKNYEEVEYQLNKNIEDWFQYYDPKTFNTIYDYNSRILNKIIDLCEFAYLNIYNETTQDKRIDNQEIIDQYNSLHSEFKKTIENALANLSENINLSSRATTDLFENNLNVLRLIESKIRQADNN